MTPPPPASRSPIPAARLLCSWLLIVLSCSAADPAPRDRPNILFIVADDLGYGDLGAYRGRAVPTPHLDRLAAEGRRYTQAYAGSTVCAPSRCALLTGLHTGHALIRGNSIGRRPDGTPHFASLREGELTLVSLLKNAGYATAGYGKWGLGDHDNAGAPWRQGFDEWLGVLDHVHAHTYYPEFIWRDARMELVRPNLGAQGEWIGDRYTRAACDFLTRRDPARPFFLYYAPQMPHGRYEVPVRADLRAKPWPAPVQGAAELIMRLDEAVGTLLAKLTELGLERDTLVVFTSDNGPETYYLRPTGDEAALETILDSNGPLRGIKRDLYEGGIRVPLLVRWPGRVAPGMVDDLVTAAWDWLPTFAELARAPVPPGLDGVSLAPALLGGKPVSRPPLYWEFHERGFIRAARLRDWKGVSPAPDRPLELYDLARDPGETTDVAAQNPAVVRDIEAFLTAARTPSPHWPARRSP